MKPRNFRYAEVATGVGPGSTPISDDRLQSLLIHENQNLRALLEGKGRISVDRDLEADLERKKATLATLQQQLQAARADRERRSQHDAGLTTQMTDLQQRLTDQEHSLRRSLADLEIRTAEGMELLEQRLSAEQRTTSDLVKHIDDRQQELDTLRHEMEHLQHAAHRGQEAETDLQHLLARLRTSPIGPIVRRRAGFRHLEARWTEQ